MLQFNYFCKNLILFQPFKYLLIQEKGAMTFNFCNFYIFLFYLTSLEHFHKKLSEVQPKH